jgi:hypothetical protein
MARILTRTESKGMKVRRVDVNKKAGKKGRAILNIT